MNVFTTPVNNNNNSHMYNLQADPMIMLREPQIWRKCELITQHLAVHSPKELQIYFSQIVENLFEYNLVSISQRGGDYRDYPYLVDLLSPTGPIFKLAEKLTTEVAVPRILFPLTKLPPGVQEQLIKQTMSPFIAHKISLDGQYLQLNPLEFLLFCFIGHVQHPKIAELKMDLNSWPTVVYFTIFESYLNHFLNPDIPDTDASNSLLANLGTRFHPCGRPVGMGHRCLLKKDALLNGSISGRSQISNSSMACGSSGNKYSTFLNIISELWLSSWKGANDNQQLLRAVRILLRRLHSSSFFEGNYLPQLKKRLYEFLKAVLSRWPLDSTFRLPLETWLSFIQPWRYSGECQSGQFCDVDQERYIPFIKDHLLFYTQLFLCTLERISVLDLTVPSNAILINRMCKVFSQDGLMSRILNLETPMSINQSIAEYESTGYTFVYLQSDEWRSKAREVVRSLRMGIARLESKIAAIDRSSNDRNWWVKMLDSIMGNAVAGSSAETRTLEQVKTSMEKLSLIFRVEIPDIAEESEIEMKDEHSMESTLNTSFRKKFDSRYLMIPEKQPCRENEFRDALDALNKWSSHLNSLYGHHIYSIYSDRETSILSWLFMYIFSAFILPPATYIEVHKEKDFLSAREHKEVRLPPRISLRCLAKHSTAGYLMFCITSIYLIGINYFFILAFTIFLTKIFVEKVYSLLYPPENDEFL